MEKIDRGGNRLIESIRERGGIKRFIKRDRGMETDGGHVKERERTGEEIEKEMEEREIEREREKERERKTDRHTDRDKLLTINDS